MQPTNLLLTQLIKLLSYHNRGKRFPIYFETDTFLYSLFSEVSVVEITESFLEFSNSQTLFRLAWRIIELIIPSPKIARIRFITALSSGGRPAFCWHSTAILLYL